MTYTMKNGCTVCRPAASPGTGGTPWEIRPAVPPVSERAPAGDVYQPLDYGQAERTPDGDSADSPAAGGTDHSADGKKPRRDRELKARDQMQWVGRMNNLKQAAEETVMNELIYS